MIKERLISLNHNPELKYMGGYMMEVQKDRVSFIPSHRFEFIFRVTKGTARSYVQKFLRSVASEYEVEVEVFTPSGLQENVKLINLEAVETEVKEEIPADILRAEVDLTFEQILAFRPIDRTDFFGY